MGVPKFCRYICERYPCVLELLSEYQIPEFDNLYLDMNGIVHNCSHPNDDDAHFRISEEDIFKNIFQYIEVLFSMIKPQKLFFMSVDGVAPRAKINQQRGRRFRTAKETEAVEARAIAKGEKISTEDKFDSNCITPGTVFMSRLTEQLKYFVTWKISTNKLWQKCKIVLSGPEVPGEGEHKIMDYIRHARSQPDHDPNTRHCLYGLDADLIMLSLCTHERHFAVLREEVKYGRKKKSQSVDKIRFCLFHISLFREYMEKEFFELKDKLSFEFDLEKILDDWILMGFLVGNDFIPNLPNLLIENDALPILYQAYKDVLPTLDGYINEAGTLKLDRFEKFMERLSQNDTAQFAEHFADLKYFQSKTGRRPNETERTSYRKSDDSPESFGSPYKSANKELSALIKSTDDMLIGHSDEEEPLGVDSDTEMYQIEFMQHKRDYYMTKLEYENVDAEVLRSQAEAYVTAIQWNLHYYYDGCCSWSWYYPHHYAPFVSDIKGFKDLEIKFDKAEPFLPFQQLLAVLPAASKKLLPPAYQGLLDDEKSPIIDYYPVDFKTDLNQKRHEWEAIVLIPFIDEKRLLDAMEPYNSELTDEEQKRNTHGPMSIITYTEEDMGLYEAPQYFPTIKSHAKVQKVNRDDLDVPPEKLIKGLMSNVNLSVYFAGFPTLQHIAHTAKLEKAKVRVFEQPSRNENMILSITTDNEVPNLRDLAEKLLGKTVFVSWPHMREARIVALSTSDRKLTLIDSKKDYNPENTRTDDLNSNLASLWQTQRSVVHEGYMSRFGIDIGNTSVLLFGLPLIGRQYVLTTQGKMSLEKTWSEIPVPYAYQSVVTDISVHDTDYNLHKDITEVYTIKSVVFMLGHPHYGAMGEVIEPGVNVKTGRVKVAMSIDTEPNFDTIKKEFAESEAQWMSTSIAAQRLGLGNHFLSRITGSIFVAQGSGDSSENNKQNVGLNLKFTKRNQEVPGYTKRTSGQWLYSAKSIGLIRSYMQNYPMLFERLAKLSGNDIYIENDLFENVPEKLIDVVNWLKDQPFASLDTRSCNTLGIYGDTIEKIKKIVEKLELDETKDVGKTVIMQVKPHLLLKPGLNSGNVPPDAKARHKLFDRVINVKESSIVPLGYKGTIVEIIYPEDSSETVYDIFFDKQFVGDITFSGATANRRYTLHCSEFINISHGTRVEHDMTSLSSGIGQNVPVPPKSWRQESNSIKKTPQTNSTFYNQRSISISKNNQNNKTMDVDNHHHQQQQQQQQQHQQQQQQQQQQQIRSIKKNESQQKRSTQITEDKKKPQLNNQKPIIQKMPMDTEIPDTTKSSMNPSKQRNVEANTEFQMLWNELQKPSSTSNVYNHKPMMPTIVPHHSQILPPSSGDPLQDKSAVLKAMLKIPNENSTTTSQGSSCKPIGSSVASNASSAPPLVQQLFDHAREASRKNNVSYCAMLLTHSQLAGRGMPRYNYVSNPHKMVSAQIVLPDMRTYCGEFCINHVEAAESAAKVVCKELKLESVPKPGISIMGATPAMWHNPRPNNVQPQLHNARPMMPPRSPQIFPPMHNPPMHMPQWNPRMQGPAPFPQHQLANVDHNRPIVNSGNPIPQPQQPQEISKIDNKIDNKKKKNPPFVPLQAQKKTRNPKPKQATRNQNSGNKETNQPQVSHLKPRDDLPKMSKEEKIMTNEKKDSDTKKTSQTAQKLQRAPKPRRSRIAANFNSASTPANGTGPPQ